MLLLLLPFIINFIPNAESSLLPGRRCIPTAIVKGPCHFCICSADGMYQCRTRPCETAMLENTTETYRKECQANLTYTDNRWICTCSVTGHWQSGNCRKKFNYFQFNKGNFLATLRSHPTCTPNSYYLIGCNICQCRIKDDIKSSLCTNHACNKIHKADSCDLWDVLRTENEFCVCSDINYFIDRLCIKVKDGEVQEITEAKLNRIAYKNGRKNFDIMRECEPHKEYFIDCNRCICSNEGKYACTNKTCVVDPDVVLESASIHRRDHFYSLPELKSDTEECVPGQKYRYMCNTCVCERNKVPSCTTMFCLEEMLNKKREITDRLLIARK